MTATGVLSGRTALVTGAAQGIGAAIAESLVGEGAQVAIADINADGADTIARSLDPSGRTAVGYRLDVRDREAIASVADAVVAQWGRLDVMVNNAALNIRRSFLEVTASEWDDVLDVNLRGVLFGCQVAAKLMQPHRFGRIINLSSDAGQQPNAFVAAHYAASKAGVAALTKVAALALAQDGITVNAVAPAAVRTPVMDALPEEQVSALESRIPVGRVGTPGEVGALVAFLASESAAYITGATYDINGGLLMR